MQTKTPKRRVKDHPGHYIREWREKLNKSQEWVAERVELTVPQVSKIENGKQGYRQHTLEMFAKALGRKPADLLRPPDLPENEMILYLAQLPERKLKRAVRLLRSFIETEGEDDEELRKVE